MLKLSLWKHIFELTAKELDLIRKKKQVLNDLLSSGKISQATYEHLSAEIEETLDSMERYHESIVSKMRSRAQELEKQIGVLEIFLANTELLHVTGEIDEETYQKQIGAINVGLEAAKQELNEIRSVLEGKPESEATQVTVAEPSVSEEVVEESVSTAEVSEVSQEPVVEESEVESVEEKSEEVTEEVTPAVLESSEGGSSEGESGEKTPEAVVSDWSRFY